MDCASNPPASSNCPHTKDAGVVCQATVSREFKYSYGAPVYWELILQQLYAQLVLSKRYDLWLVPMLMKDVWKSAIETSGDQFVTEVLVQMMPGQHVAKLDTLENPLVSN